MKFIWIPSLLVLALIGCGGDDDNSENLAFETKATLGEALFSDVNLSANRTQSCATCHNPEHAFIDDRVNTTSHSADAPGSVSLGDDGVSLGDRNTPTAAYARFSPEFGEGTRQRLNSQQSDYEGFIGGQFHDGRASTLAEQAEAPPLNSIEMGMPDEASVVERLMEDSDYVDSFKSLYGDDIWDNTDAAYEAMGDAIAAFEETDVFAPFDSKYDRSLTGDYLYDPLSKAALGKALFFSQQFTNCATCHQLNANSSKTETFSGYEYHNIGVPEHQDVRLANGSVDGFVDQGLLDNDAVTDTAQTGKYKVPTLRNVAVTGPYMHNGMFADLDTVIRFYDHFLDGSSNTLNPETGLVWADPEVSENISFTELEDGSLLDEDDVDALVCFLRTLTDAQFEYLIPDDGLDCD